MASASSRDLDPAFMYRCCLKKKLLLVCGIVISLAFFNNTATFARAQSNSKLSPAPISSKSTFKSFWGNIDTHWGGRLKTAGVSSRVTDDTIFAPVGTGTYYDGSANLRLINETFFTDFLYFEADYELLWVGGDSIRKQKQLESLLPALKRRTFLPGTPLNDDRRFLDLTDTIKEEDSWFLLQRLDRLFVDINGQWGAVRIGRQAVTWGGGFVFNPMDLFNPFAPTAIDRDYKIGDDMVNVQLQIPNIGNFQGLYVARRNPENHEIQSNQNSAAGKLHFSAGNTEFDLMGARHYKDEVAGIGSTGYLGNTAWRLDGTWTFRHDGDNYLSIVANMDYSWVWFGKNIYGFIEYYFNGLGENDYGKALTDPAIFERLARGELFVLGRNYLSGHLEIELHPLLKVSLTAINNLKDPSGVLQPYATWDITQNLQLTGGLNFYWGDRGSEYGGFTLPGTDIRSKTPDSAYLWLIYYF
ncbi:MAG: hypothetical protein B6I22_09225 [Desulfobacteraceae bacterium 4572_123]|nr:MAG: hypothetical protein B6I22_09225 [Desulfobacteraceae bacterium 4572_123]